MTQPHQVLARKWRPRRFDDLVGQQHAIQALSNALAQQRLHHAYLFTGTRGVGKTTIARIIAKCLNCESGITNQPCGECNTCQSIDAGRFVDLIEVDAASRTKVEDTRELLDNVQYAPTQGRYKVFLIDEVHMLSGHSFNALLKTLEEPPPHVKFLLATTDPQKLPATVLSRCLQFHLKNLTIEQISQHLQFICDQENITAEPEALNRLARAADGSMRDALSLLDQAIAFGEQSITLESTQSMLGTLGTQQIYPLIESLIAEDANALFAAIQALAEHGVDFAQVLEEVLTVIHQIAILQVMPDAHCSLWDDPTQPRAWAQTLTAETVQLYYQIGLHGRRDLPLAPTPRSGFEMTMLRMLAFKPNDMKLVSPTNQTPATRKPTTSTTPHATAKAQVPPPKPAPSSQQNPISAKATNPEWNTLIQQLGLHGPTLAIAQHCAFEKLDENRLTLRLSPSHAALLNDKHRSRIADALTQHFNRPMKVDILVGETTTSTPAKQAQQRQQAQLDAASKTIQQDPTAQAIMNTFNATIVPDSIESHD